LTGAPKFGVPFEFQFTTCTEVYLFPSQAPSLFAVAWYTFHHWVPSGDVKNLLMSVYCPNS
jgi:hypothetical protein